MFVGPGGVGKSSFQCGLLNKPLPIGDSTQLAQSMTVKPISQVWASASEGPETYFVELTDEDDMMQITAMLHLVAGDIVTAAIEYTSSTPGSSDSESESEKFAKGITEKVIDQIIIEAQSAASALQSIPRSEILLRMWDCGGQRVFLVVLPAFLTRRTMFLLMYDARRRLTDTCVSRTYRNGEVINEHNYKLSTKDMMLDWMACIHTMLCDKQSSNEHVPKYPRFITVGTHGDDPDVNARKGEILAELNSACVGKSFVHLHTGSVIVNNTTAGCGESEDPVYKDVRREICSFAKDLTIPTPIKWVLFRRVFQKAVAEKKSPIMSYEEAMQIGRACNISDEDIPYVLQFYHDLAIFFHYSNVSSLKDYIIANPQWLIDQFAKMLAPEGFEGNQNPSLWELFRKQGILVQPLYEEVWKHSELQAQSLIDLLVHFLLASPISEESQVSNVPGKKYFVSCILEAYSAENESKSKKAVVLEAAPIHVRFSTEHVPPGFFSRLITTLVNEPKCDVIFTEGVYFNRITMLYGNPTSKIDKIIVSCGNSSIEFAVSRTKNRPSQYYPFSLVCQDILKLVDKCVGAVLKWLPGIEVSYAFLCDHCHSEDPSQHQHFIPLPANSTTQAVPHCEKLQFPELTFHHKVWLNISEDEQLLHKASELSEHELKQLTQIVESRGKMKELANVLEVSETLKTLEGSSDASFETLLAWSAEMQRHSINVRAHLIYHLKTIGVNDAATKLSLGRPLISGNAVLSGSRTPSGGRCTATGTKSSLTGVAMEQSNGHKQIEPMSEEGTSLHDVDSTTILGESDIKIVMREVGTLVARYPQLGRELGVPPHELERLQRQYGVNMDQAIHEMVLLWLRGRSPRTWQALVRAVANPAGGNDFALAGKIAASHEAAGVAMRMAQAPPVPQEDSVGRQVDKGEDDTFPDEDNTEQHQHEDEDNTEQHQHESQLQSHDVSRQQLEKKVTNEAKLLEEFEEKQQSLSSIEAKMRESVRDHGDAVKEKDTTIKSLQDQVSTLQTELQVQSKALESHDVSRQQLEKKVTNEAKLLEEVGDLKKRCEQLEGQLKVETSKARSEVKTLSSTVQEKVGEPQMESMTIGKSQNIAEEAMETYQTKMDKTDARVHQLIDSGQSPARNLVRGLMADLLTFVLVPSAFLSKVFSILRTKLGITVAAVVLLLALLLYYLF